MSTYWKIFRGYRRLPQDNLNEYHHHDDGDYDSSSSPSIPMSTFFSSSSSASQNRFHRRPHLSPTNYLRIFFHYFSIKRLAVFLVVLFVMTSAIILSSGIPPSYDDIWAYERSLPQHNLTEAFGDLKWGRRKYLRFEGGVKGRGFNNVFQEALILSYVAYLTDRAFVFEDYVWSQTSFSSSIDEWALRPSRIPFNAFISGPTTGGPIIDITNSSSSSSSSNGREGSIRKRSVNLEFFDAICPVERRFVINASESPDDKEGQDRVVWWKDRLEKVRDEPCVVVDDSKVIFDIDFFGSPNHIIPAFDSLRTSPILTSFTWSPLILSAVSRNFAVLQPPSLSSLYSQTPPSSTIKGLVAIHLRRGDFFGHCLYLLKWRVKYMGLNMYPGVGKDFDPDEYLRQVIIENESGNGDGNGNGNGNEGGKSNSNEELDEKEKSRVLKPYYFEHCLPEIDQIVARLREVREEMGSSSSSSSGEGGKVDLKRLYILSNGKASWLNELGKELKGDGWVDVRSTTDLRLDKQQKYVSGAIDMAIAEKAEVFIGNGFSSLSSNIVMLRLAKGLPPNSNHFL
ncbi:hypothetical protein K435DRAFT_973071 [Dendrothele bispora CBS 962.96]|uniref:Uncharacterized protein n=1 Tax=Dendrothele bispora (strain CBS 962.96) TaxID=1314807 RepID=A0A4S8KV71_DENBC|nr:hypothetical protein K435DRAFT_973071 [Dendrothele bispora CBS 962.96]